MAEVNCSLCKKMSVDLFSGVHSCTALNCGCHPEASNFRLKIGEKEPRWLPELGVKKCPGMEVETIKTID